MVEEIAEELNDGSPSKENRVRDKSPDHMGFKPMEANAKNFSTTMILDKHKD